MRPFHWPAWHGARLLAGLCVCLGCQHAAMQPEHDLRGEFTAPGLAAVSSYHVIATAPPSAVAMAPRLPDPVRTEQNAVTLNVSPPPPCEPPAATRVPLNPHAGDAQDTEAVRADATAVFLKEPGPSLTALTQRAGTDGGPPHAPTAPAQLRQAPPPATAPAPAGPPAELPPAAPPVAPAPVPAPAADRAELLTPAPVAAPVPVTGPAPAPAQLPPTAPTAPVPATPPAPTPDRASSALPAAPPAAAIQQASYSAPAAEPDTPPPAEASAQPAPPPQAGDDTDQPTEVTPLLTGVHIQPTTLDMVPGHGPPPEGPPTTCYGHAADYGWLTGEIYYLSSHKVWRLRYVAPGEDDRYSGTVNLTGDGLPADCRSGQTVRVEGTLLDPESTARRPTYWVRHLTLLKPAADDAD
jgi:hypothetical protein